MIYDEPGFKTNITDPMMEYRGYGMVPQGADASLRVRFYLEAVHQTYRSKVEGRDIYEDVLFVEIIAPGGKQINNMAATEEHKARFPQAWANFCAGKFNAVVGTPLSVWGVLTPAEVKSYEALEVVTVEQLAEMSDVHVQKFMRGNERRQAAKDWLANKEKEAPISRLKAENEMLRADMELLKKQFREQFQEELEVRNEEVKKRGRPKKTVEEPLVTTDEEI